MLDRAFSGNPPALLVGLSRRSNNRIRRILDFIDKCFTSCRILEGRTRMRTQHHQDVVSDLRHIGIHGHSRLSVIQPEGDCDLNEAAFPPNLSREVGRNGLQRHNVAGSPAPATVIVCVSLPNQAKDAESKKSSAKRTNGVEHKSSAAG